MQYGVEADFGYGPVMWCGMRFGSAEQAGRAAERLLKGITYEVKPWAN